MSTTHSTATESDVEPDYYYHCNVTNIVDGDTIDVVIDLGFDVQITDRVRLDGIDTAETYGVENNTAEYDLGMDHRNKLAIWIERTIVECDNHWAFCLHSKEYERGVYGRVIGDIWSKYHQEWATDCLLSEFNDLRTNNS